MSGVMLPMFSSYNAKMPGAATPSAGGSGSGSSTWAPDSAASALHLRFAAHERPPLHGETQAQLQRLVVLAAAERRQGTQERGVGGELAAGGEAWPAAAVRLPRLVEEVGGHDKLFRALDHGHHPREEEVGDGSRQAGVREAGE